jgi:hypothetical protein
VRVFVSWDRGQTWHFYEEKKPADGRFRFRPKQDGEFWFATQTVDRSGQSDSPQPSRPQLRLIIDTGRPQLLAQANVARPGEVMLAFSALDASLNPASLKLEYQDAAGNGGPWQEINVDPAALKSTAGQISGRAVFRPEVTGKTINLRAEVADSAGNVAYYTQRLSLALPHSMRAGTAAPAPPPDRTATRWPSESPLEVDEETGLTPKIVTNPFARQDRLVSAAPTLPSVEQLPPPSEAADTLPPPVAPQERSESDAGPTPRVVSGDNRLPAEETRPVLPAPQSAGQPPQQPEAIPSEPAAPGESVATPLGSSPRLTNTRRFRLDYDVQTVGPEGLADVELWGTSDGGRSWAKWGSDPDKQSPLDVEVNGESVYGFRIVIVGKSGLASNAPHSGDAADIWVGIDLTRPKARIVSAAYGQGESAGKLDIRWEASDANLAARPITLAIGDRPDGPFTPIAAGLPNSGQYYWEFDPRSPRQIYLRLEARDDAGNTTIDQLTEPIRVEGLQPQGRIRGFAPAPETQGGASRQPLFR